jgi:predicted Zn-ribbon and HTH transcriptional regulator
MSTERSECEDCGLEFDPSELDVDGLCQECRDGGDGVEEEEEEEEEQEEEDAS